MPVDPFPPAEDEPLHQDPIADTGKNLFFIVGCGRSGTTLLQVMLDAHPEICLPIETHFFSMFYREQKASLGSIKDEAAYQRAARAMVEFEHIKPLAISADEVLAISTSHPYGWETLFLALMTIIRQQRNVPRIGEKTPGHIVYIDELSKWFPEAKFINVVRDPRAVVASYMKATFYRDYGRNPYHAIHAWQSAIDMHKAALSSLPSDRYVSVRYEDLVQSPDEELQEISRFLGVEFREEMLDYHKREHAGFLSREKHKLGTLEPVYRGSLDKWKKELSPGHIQLIEAALGSRMVEQGYLETAPPPSSLLSGHLLYLKYEKRVRARSARLLQALGLRKGKEAAKVAEIKTP